MPRRMIAPGKTVRRVITIKTTKKPQQGRVVPTTPQGLPSRVVPNKTGGIDSTEVLARIRALGGNHPAKYRLSPSSEFKRKLNSETTNPHFQFDPEPTGKPPNSG